MAAAAQQQKALGEVPPEEPSDACCWACSGGGDVACCDGCRAVYHLSCIGLEQLPEDDWYCPLCHCRECKQICRGLEDPVSIDTRLLPVIPKHLQPRQHPEERLPSGPGYLCPQQVRLWLQEQQQQQQHQQLGEASAAQAFVASAEQGPQWQQHVAGGSQGGAAAGQTQQKPKRLKSEPPSSSGSVSPTHSSSSAASYIRCCCCQQACHIRCLPAALRKQYSGRPPLSTILCPATPPGAATTPASAPPPGRRSGTPGKQNSRGSSQKLQGIQQKKQQQQQQQQPPQPTPVDAYFCSVACQQLSNQVATRCAQGLVQVDALGDGTPICWQLVQPAAVAAALVQQPDVGAAAAAAAAATAGPRGGSGALQQHQHQQQQQQQSGSAVGLLGTGVAAGHSPAQAEVLARVLRDALSLMSVELGPAWEVRSSDDVLPWILGGLRQVTPGGLLDLSHCHVALLWLGCTLASAAVVRLHGPAVLEVTLAATQQQLQHKKLGRLLLSCIERFALETCKVKQAWMPALNDVARPCTGLSLLPSWDRQPGLGRQLQLTPGCSVNILGLNTVVAAAAAGGSEGGSSSSSDHTPKEQQQQQQSVRPKDAQTCWGHHLKYGPAPSVSDWMQLPKHLLLRYSYVPFIMKRLGSDTLVPLPKFPAKVAPQLPAAHLEEPAAAADGNEDEEAAPPDIGTQARQLLNEAFPPSGYLRRQSLRQNVRQPQQLRKRRRWHEEFDDSEETEEEEEAISEDDDDDDDDDDEPDEEDDSKGRRKHQQHQQQCLRPPSQRQQFQEQVRQQFLARQQAYQKSQQLRQQ